MADGPSLLRRTFLGGSVLAAVGQYSRAVSAQETKSLTDYANDAGYIDRDGVFQAVQDRREGLITESLLNRVVRYWKAGEPVVGGDTANPARLIESHIATLGNTDFMLDIQEYQDINSTTPTKEVQFQWDNTNQQSQLTESSKRSQEIDVAQIFTQDRQHVDIQQNNRQVNQASLPIDKGPVYLDGRELLDQLLVGASLSFDRLVSTEDGSLSKYTITDHLRLSEANGHVIGDAGEYISELEIQWTQSDGQQFEIDIYTEKDISGSISSLRTSKKGNRKSASVNNSVKPAFFHDDEDSGSGRTCNPVGEFDACFDGVSVSEKEYSVGDNVEITASVLNTGQKLGTFRVAVIIETPSGERKYIPEKRIYDIPVGETKSEDFEWEIPKSADGGKYSVTVDIYDTFGDHMFDTAAYTEDFTISVPPTSTRVSPDDEVETTVGESVTFRAKGMHSGGNLQGAEWYINGGEEEDVNYFDDGSAGEVTFTHQFEEPDTYIVQAEIFTRGLTYNDDAVEWRVDVREETSEYELDVDSEIGGGLGVDPPGQSIGDFSDTYEEGSEVTITAVSDSGYTFAEWVGDVPDTKADDESITIEIDEDKDITATFEEETVEYELDVESESGGSVEIDSPDISIDDLPDAYEDGTKVTITALPDSGYTFAEWVGDVPDTKIDDESITIEIDQDKYLAATFEQKTSLSIEISDITVDNSTYSLGDVARTTTTIRNNADSSQDVTVQLELRDPTGNMLDTTAVKTVAADDTTSLSSQWRLSDSLTTGQYELTARVTVASDVVDNTTKSSLFEVTESSGPVTVTIETVTAQGDPFKGARITLTPLDGGSDRSIVSSYETDKFTDIPPGKHDLTADSTQLNQKLTFGLVVDGTSDLTRKIVFQPTDVIYDTVFNGGGQQHIPNATVSIPALQETATTDAKGEFVFDADIPDGTYEFEITVGSENKIVDSSEVKTFNKTREAYIDRTITFDIPVNLNQPDGDTSQLISEENRLVSIVVRNLEKRDVLLPLEQQFIMQYGLVKGIITGTQGFINDIVELFTNLDDIPKMIDSMIKLINMILDDPSVIFKLISKMIDGILNKQEKDNPFEKGTIDYQTFFAAWMLGYGGIKIAISIIGTKGATKVSKIAKSSSKISKSVTTLKGKVGGGNLPDSIGFKRRIRPCAGATSTTSASSNCLTDTELLGIHTLSKTADSPKLIKSLSVTARKLKRDGGANAPNPWKPLRDKDLNEAKGDVMEHIFSVKLRAPDKSPRLSDYLPSAFEKYDLRPRVTTELDDWKKDIPIGQARIINPSEKDIIKQGEKIGEIEFDPIVVARNQDGELELSHIYEVKSGGRDTSEGALDQVEDSLDDIDQYADQDGVKIGQNNEIGGLPPRIFKEFDRSRITTVGPKDKNFDIDLDYTAAEIENTVRHLQTHLDTYKSLPEVDL